MLGSERDTSVLPVPLLFNGLGLQLAPTHLTCMHTHTHTHTGHVHAYKYGRRLESFRDPSTHTHARTHTHINSR